MTCLCPTYGRFERLRDAVACFLLQDYPGVKELLILNDAPVPLQLTQADSCQLSAVGYAVRLANAPDRYPCLGHKRQALLNMARTAVVAHWDDDDLYLPWHLSMVVARLVERQAAAAPSLSADRCPLTAVRCAKPGAGWWVLGPREGPFDVRGIHHNVFEGQMVFDRDRALELGGYPPVDSGQAKALLDAFDRAGELHTWNPADEDVSYVYRWGDGADHVSARRAPVVDADFGGGQPLIPDGDPRTWARARLSGQFGGLLMGFKSRLSRRGYAALSERLLAAVRPGSAAVATRGQPEGKRGAASDAGPR